ncbi:MFS transporter [Sphaerisporangium sp. NBC_01403]|uniref:MFS transporter n=1 Tax=Sphaerisporangium sp. NBC_01403 TaxID=2903599 RepID=UPI00324417A3
MSDHSRRPWLGLAVLLFPTLLMTVDLGVLWLATPALAADLGPSSTQLLWINDVYGFAVASLLVLSGNLGDRYGHRRLLLFGIAVFTLASIMAAYAPGPGVLIAARAILGAAGAAIVPATLSLISHMFTDPVRRARAIALWVTALSSGIAIGPVVSGVMLERFWWGSVFLVAVPIMLVVLAVVPLLVPRHANPQAGRLDRAGASLLLLALMPLVYAIKSLGENGFAPVTFAALAVGLAFGTLFLRRQRRAATPLLDVRLFAHRTFAAALALMFIGLAAMNGVEYLMPQYLQLVSGLPPVQAGLLMVLPALGLAAGSQLTPVLTRRVRPAYVIAAGAALAGAAFAMMAALPSDASGAVLAIGAATAMMLGLAPVTVLGTAIAAEAAPPGKAGQASSVGQTAYELGLAFGIAATGSVMAAVYRNHVQAASPAGAPADVVREAAGNLGGGLAIAERLPGELGEAMAATVRNAFASGLHAAAIISGSLAAALLALALLLLRRVAPTGARETPAAQAPVPTTAGSSGRGRSSRLLGRTGPAA